jgi:hypothetical protein
LVFSKEQKRNATNRSGRESSRLERESKKDLIVKREFHPTILLFLILHLAVGLGVRLLVPLYVTASLLFGLENYLGYLHASAKFRSSLAALYLPYAEYLVSKHLYTCLDHAIYLQFPHLLTSEDHV